MTEADQRTSSSSSSNEQTTPQVLPRSPQTLSREQHLDLITMLLRAEKSRLRRPHTSTVTVRTERDSARPTGPRNLDDDSLWTELQFRVSDACVAAVQNLLRNFAAQHQDLKPSPDDRWTRVDIQPITQIN